MVQWSLIDNALAKLKREFVDRFRGLFSIQNGARGWERFQAKEARRFTNNRADLKMELPLERGRRGVWVNVMQQRHSRCACSLQHDAPSHGQEFAAACSGRRRRYGGLCAPFASNQNWYPVPFTSVCEGELIPFLRSGFYKWASCCSARSSPRPWHCRSTARCGLRARAFTRTFAHQAFNRREDAQLHCKRSHETSSI